MMVEFRPAPTMVIELFTYRAPLLPEKSPATFGLVRVIVPAGTITVSPLALRMASRILHELDRSPKPALLQAFVMGEVGVGSSLRLTKNVGSGIGITANGATSP